MLLGLRNGSLDTLTLEDAFGLRTEISFFDVQRNLPLELSLFRFTPPSGIDVIGDDSEAGETNIGAARNILISN